MSDTLLLGTRKGLFTLSRRGSHWEVERLDFLGQTVTAVLDDPHDRSLYAALHHGHFGAKLHRSDDGGASWSEVGVPVYPEGATYSGFPGPDGQPTSKPASMKEFWVLEAAGAARPGELWAGTIPGGLFHSSDRGASWRLIESLWDRAERKFWFGGGKDDPGIHTVCVDPRDTAHVTVAISCGGVWETHDAGVTWNLIGQGLRAEYVPPELAYEPNGQDAHRLAQSAADPTVMWVQHHNGVFHSTAGARTFRELTDTGPSTFGFAVCAHPLDPQTAWFVPAQKDEFRIPVAGRLVVTRTRDGGQSFTTLRDGLPQAHCYDLIFRHGFDVDARGERLSIGSSTGGLWTSDDGGDHWQAASNTLPQIYCVRFRRG